MAKIEILLERERERERGIATGSLRAAITREREISLLVSAETGTKRPDQDLRGGLLTLSGGSHGA